MVNHKKNKKKKSHSRSSTSCGRQQQQQNALQQREPEVAIPIAPPFTYTNLKDLTGRTVNEWIALLAACPELTDAVQFHCNLETILNVSGNGAGQNQFTTLVVNENIAASEHKMIELAEQVINLFGGMITLSIIYHPNLNRFFPILISQMLQANVLLYKLSFNGSSDQEEVMTQWLSSISTINNLKMLSWHGLNMPPNFDGQFNFGLPCLGALEIKTFHPQITPFIRQLNDKMETLNLFLYKPKLKSSELKRVFKDNPKHGENLVRLHIFFEPKFTDQITQCNILQLFTKQCPKIEKLNIRQFAKVPFRELFECISLLPNLKELFLSFMEIKVDKDLAPKTSVTHLEIWNPLPKEYLIGHFRSTIVRLFPNLEWLILTSCNMDLINDLIEHQKMHFPRLVGYKFSYPPITTNQHENPIVFQKPSCDKNKWKWTGSASGDLLI